MSEPSTDFSWLAIEERELESVKSEARIEGYGDALNRFIELFTCARNPTLRAAALRYLASPCGSSVAGMARQVGVSKATFNRELRKIRALRVLRDDTKEDEGK